MGETGIIRFQRSLDPQAQEFRPVNYSNQTHLQPNGVFGPPLQPHPFYYSFVSPYPPAVNAVQIEPFVYPQFPVNNPPGGIVFPLPRVQAPVPPSSPTRSLLLRWVPIDVSESVVRRDLEAFGDVRGVQMERIKDGIVTVHFYDLRHAVEACREMRNRYSQHQTQFQVHCNNNNWLSSSSSRFAEINFEAPRRLGRGLIAGCAVLVQFVVPASNAVPGGRNQGTVVVFNLGSDVPTVALKDIFERFGPVKEVRETPLKKQQKFIEFFDVRDAAKALNEMNGKEIYGKPVVVEFSRPGGGHGRKLFNPAISTSSPPPLPQPSRSSKFCNRSFYNYSKTPNKLHYANSRSFSYADKLVKEFNAVNFGGIETGKSVGSTSRRVKANKIFKEQSPSPSKQYEQAGAAPQSRVSFRLRRNNMLKKTDPHFLINENAMKDEPHCRDSRTTVMIKNIPNKYSLELLVNMLDNHCIRCNEHIAVTSKDLPLSSYDFVYLPIDFNNKCNVGYGFVNMTSPEGAWRLYKAFHLQPWEVFNSRKICQITYARVQGLEASKEHFRKSKFPRGMEECELPLVFSPPRDGIQLTDPVAVVCNVMMNNENQSQKSSCCSMDLSSAPNSSAVEEEEEDENEDAMTGDQSESLDDNGRSDSKEIVGE